MQPSFKRRLSYALVIDFGFIVILIGAEALTRLLLPNISSLDLFVSTSQQRAQVANQQAGIFEGDPLLLWRLKANLDHTIWDYTVVTTNAEHIRSSVPLLANQPSRTCLVAQGYR